MWDSLLDLITFALSLAVLVAIEQYGVAENIWGRRRSGNERGKWKNWLNVVSEQRWDLNFIHKTLAIKEEGMSDGVEEWWKAQKEKEASLKISLAHWALFCNVFNLFFSLINATHFFKTNYNKCIAFSMQVNRRHEREI
jgi:hypothetical protein